MCNTSLVSEPNQMPQDEAGVKGSEWLDDEALDDVAGGVSRHDSRIDDRKETEPFSHFTSRWTW